MFPMPRLLLCPLAVLIVPGLGCGARVERGDGGAPATSSTSGAHTSGSATGTGTLTSSAGSSFDPNACLNLTSESECGAAGCSWWQGRLYASNNGAAPVCENGTPFWVCTYFTPGGYQSPEVYRRDIPQGRVVLQYQIGTTVAGFQNCPFFGMINDCNCFP